MIYNFGGDICMQYMEALFVMNKMIEDVNTIRMEYSTFNLVKK